MWKDKLQEIINEKNLYGEKINDGANVEEINCFIDRIQSELNVIMPKEYVEVLEVVNGIEFNGVIIYGIDGCLLNRQQNQTVNGLIETNKIWYENEWQRKYIFLGEGNISWYAYDLEKCQYIELDNPSGRESAVFGNYEGLVEKALSDALL